MNLKLAIESADGKCSLVHAHPVMENWRWSFDVRATFDREEKVQEAVDKLVSEVSKFPVQEPKVEVIQCEKQDKTCWYAEFAVSYVFKGMPT